ncbi:hypothetical protein KUTeg_017047 [Tegillarca granosa]|uniref:SMB domain-containing protein n=1 Tax=Tegillarca granosa TaxID=220873 RepID=A0ABQ9EMK7_TEGGR|nr:hypothetical protein KUTeg_017047 [Tegillarca granosa]
MAFGRHNYLIFFCLFFVILFTLSLSDDRLEKRKSRKKRYIEWGEDLRGPYCATRQGVQCCDNRNDDCSVPILGTLCYCDVFCNQTADDCCPDYWSYCRGGDPNPLRQACDRDGVLYPPNSVLRDNCNQCTCTRDPRSRTGYSFRCTNNPRVVRSVNNDRRYGWRASNYSQFWGLTLNEGKRYRLGTMPPDNQVMRMIPVQMDMVREPPKSFDSRQKWPNYVHPVRDQGNCGASWAFSTAAVASDRLAIESEGILTEELSPQHLLSCNTARGQQGCDGGYLDKAWWFLRQHGLVTDDCYPYQSGFYDRREQCMMPRYNRTARKKKS